MVDELASSEDVSLLGTRIEKNLDLTGYLIPWKEDDNHPLLVSLTRDVPHGYMLVFSTKEKLDNFFKEFPDIGYDLIKEIEDNNLFLDGLDAGAKAILDPEKQESGTIRFTEIKPFRN
jgi:hypothetical protein